MKRLMKSLMSIAIFGVFFLMGSILFSATASAYIDPSAMTYIVQVVVGIVIAGGAAFAFYFKKLKRALRRKKEDKTPVQKAFADDEDFDDDDEFDDSDIDDENE